MASEPRQSHLHLDVPRSAPSGRRASAAESESGARGRFRRHRRRGRRRRRRRATAAAPRAPADATAPAASAALVERRNNLSSAVEPARNDGSLCGAARGCRADEYGALLAATRHTPETIGIVNRLYARDFALLNYTKVFSLRLILNYLRETRCV